MRLVFPVRWRGSILRNFSGRIVVEWVFFRSARFGITQRTALRIDRENSIGLNELIWPVGLSWIKASVTDESMCVLVIAGWTVIGDDIWPIDLIFFCVEFIYLTYSDDRLKAQFG